MTRPSDGGPCVRGPKQPFFGQPDERGEPPNHHAAHLDEIYRRGFQHGLAQSHANAVTEHHACEHALARLAELNAAIAKHHAARGHGRCWQNDAELYRAAGLEPGDPALPPRGEFRAACQRYEAEQYEGEPSTRQEATP